MRATHFAAVAFLVLCRVGPAPAASPTTAPDVPPLIAQLDADDWHARDAAVAGLVALGEAARPAVADAAAHATSPEVRSRAAGVIAALNKLVNERPMEVTLHLKGVTPRQAFAALCQVSGLRVGYWPDSLWGPREKVPTINVDLDDRPVWSAFRDVCRHAGGVVELGSPSDALTISKAERSAADPLAGPWSGSSRVIVCAKPADGDDDGSLWLLTLVDPGLHLTRSGNRAVVSAVLDDHGRSLLRDPYAALWTPEPLSYCAVKLAPPVTGATKISVVRGSILTSEVLRSERVVIDDAAHAGPEPRTFGSITVRLSDWRVADGKIRYVLRAWSDGTAELSSESLLMDMSLEDQGGKPVGKPAAWSVGHDRGTLVYHGQRKIDGPVNGPVRLVWQVATHTRPLTIPFEFRDLPLPRP